MGRSGVEMNPYRGEGVGCVCIMGLRVLFEKGCVRVNGEKVRLRLNR